MIGGGVLAYVLLGVDLIERTGDCTFLILDPHIGLHTPRGPQAHPCRFVQGLLEGEWLPLNAWCQLPAEPCT